MPCLRLFSPARFRLLAAAVLLCAVAALGAPGGAHATQLRGAQIHPLWADSGDDVIVRELDLLRAAGANSVRIDLPWQNVEWTAKGSRDPNFNAWLDWLFAQTNARGLKVVLTFWSSPCWASSAPASLSQGCPYGWWDRGVGNYPPTNPQDYADAAAFVAQRWGSSLAALEVWNEPNGPNFFISSNPALDYTRLMQATYPAVKRVAPNLPVLMTLGGTDTAFLGQLYADGVRGSYDAIAVHPYYQPDLSGLRALRTFTLAHGDSSQLWATEIGWPTSVMGNQGQADLIASALHQLAALPYVAAVEVYGLRDKGTDPAVVEDHFGMLDRNLNPKPGWTAFVATLRDLAPTSGSTSGSAGTSTPPPPPAPPRVPPPTTPVPPAGVTRNPGTAPKTRLIGRPRQTSRTVTVRFASSDPAATFTCKLDGKSWRSCGSPSSIRGLRPGRHRLSVRAKDRAGRVELKPVTATWTTRRR